MAKTLRGIMKRSSIFLLSLCLTIGPSISPTSSLQAFPPSPKPAPTATAYVPSWPKIIDKDGNHIIVYQPQLKSWQKYRTLVADTAVSITPNGGKQILGVISWRANTIANVSTRMVLINDIEVLSSRFPYLDPQQEALMQQRVRQFYPTITFTTSIERMIASLNKSNTPPLQSIPVSQEVPTILVSMSPAIVLTVDGEPILAPVEGASLQSIVNTNWDVFYDNSDYFLLDGKTWLKAKQLNGPWVATTKLPPDMSNLPKTQWADVLKAVPPPPGVPPAPKVFFTHKPAELIVFRGQPVYAPIPGTNLSYATNTDSSVFLHKPDNQIYVLISGRWFRAGSIEAPYVYAGNSLPPDFARIPPGQSYSAVLFSVPGTEWASDAVLLSQVPTTAIINRSAAEASVKVVYAGEPVFVPIEGTTMFYATNTQERVIRVGDTYYLCYQAIWFVSKAPMGPWKVAEVVPQVIYTIPPSSPVYNVTYVVVSNPTPTTVETSYSSGYLGVFVLGMAVGATVVYGTGYYYPPYIYYGPRYPVYYPYPCTYGVAAVYNPYTGFYGVGHAVYGPYGSAGTAAWYNPSTGTYGRAVTTQNAYGGHTYAQAYNPWTGTYAATSQGHNAYSQWGSSVVTNGNNWAQAQHVTNANGTAGSFQTSKGSEGAGFSGANGNSGFVAKDANNNNVYAGADGNVYKKDSSGNWSKWNNGSWTPVDPSTGLQQTKNQNPVGSAKGSTAKTPAPNPSGTQPGSAGSSNGSQAGQNRPSRSQTDQPPSGGGSNLGSQLNDDARSRDRGDQLEQNGRGGGRRGSAGGGRSPRR
jgi:hypothetical protein